MHFTINLLSTFALLGSLGPLAPIASATPTFINHHDQSEGMGHLLGFPLSKRGTESPFAKGTVNHRQSHERNSQVESLDEVEATDKSIVAHHIDEFFINARTLAEWEVKLKDFLKTIETLEYCLAQAPKTLSYSSLNDKESDCYLNALGSRKRSHRSHGSSQDSKDQIVGKLFKKFDVGILLKSYQESNSILRKELGWMIKFINYWDKEAENAFSKSKKAKDARGDPPEFIKLTTKVKINEESISSMDKKYKFLYMALVGVPKQKSLLQLTPNMTVDRGILHDALMEIRSINKKSLDETSAIKYRVDSALDFLFHHTSDKTAKQTLMSQKNKFIMPE
ncbi:MAG: hypothetical protein DHS80DRAFT_21944 [Piptocephalis tieghemiana]|nr:MAG: hypothetical protein DHS80DRAFT_21944 [Piptocephalis tieghemiana]